jgi:hypothetical protein
MKKIVDRTFSLFFFEQKKIQFKEKLLIVTATLSVITLYLVSVLSWL